MLFMCQIERQIVFLDSLTLEMKAICFHEKLVGFNYLTFVTSEKTSVFISNLVATSYLTYLKQLSFYGTDLFIPI